MDANKLLKNIKYLKQKKKLYDEIEKTDEKLDKIIKIYEAAFPTFTDRQKKAINIRYFKENSLIDTALEMGWSEKTLYRDFKKIETTISKISDEIDHDLNIDKYI